VVVLEMTRELVLRCVRFPELMLVPTLTEVGESLLAARVRLIASGAAPWPIVVLEGRLESLQVSTYLVRFWEGCATE
jgi:hypothetical protein